MQRPRGASAGQIDRYRQARNTLYAARLYQASNLFKPGMEALLKRLHTCVLMGIVARANRAHVDAIRAKLAVAHHVDCAVADEETTTPGQRLNRIGSDAQGWVLRLVVASPSPATKARRIGVASGMFGPLPSAPCWRWGNLTALHADRRCNAPSVLLWRFVCTARRGRRRRDAHLPGPKLECASRAANRWSGAGSDWPVAGSNSFANNALERNSL